MEEAAKLARYVRQYPRIQQAPANSFNSFETDYSVTTALEDSSRTFVMQKAMLCNLSTYFVKALDGDFEKSAARTLKLPGCDSDIFQLFLYWTCNRTLPIGECTQKIPNTEASATRHREECVYLVRLWAFEDACLMPELQNAAMKALLNEMYTHRVPVEAVREAFATTAHGLLIREATMKEAFRACIEYEDGYDTEEKEVLDTIPGLFKGFTDELISCCGPTSYQCRHGSTCFSALEEDKEHYMVYECSVVQQATASPTKKQKKIPKKKRKASIDLEDLE